jgi:hypothetical protein
VIASEVTDEIGRAQNKPAVEQLHEATLAARCANSHVTPAVTIAASETLLWRSPSASVAAGRHSCRPARAEGGALTG